VELQQLDNTGILYRRWGPSSPKAIVLLVHGLGAHTARWDFLADFFAAREIASYAIELKGFGQTPDRPRGHIDSFNIWRQNILALLAAIKRQNPGLKVFILGESLGGLVSFLIADKFAGQVLISPAFANAMKFPLTAYLTLLNNILFNPRKTIPVPFTAEMCTRDAAYQKVMNDNPDELRVASVKLLINTLFAQLGAKRWGNQLKTPTLFLLAGHDLLVDANASRAAFRGLAAPDKTKIEYPEMYHALSIEQGREKVFADILAWLDKRI